MRLLNIYHRSGVRVKGQTQVSTRYHNTSINKEFKINTGTNAFIAMNKKLNHNSHYFDKILNMQCKSHVYLIRRHKDILSAYSKYRGRYLVTVNSENTKKVIENYNKKRRKSLEYKKQQLWAQFDLKKMILFDSPEVLNQNTPGQVIDFVI